MREEHGLSVNFATLLPYLSKIYLRLASAKSCKGWGKAVFVFQALKCIKGQPEDNS